MNGGWGMGLYMDGILIFHVIVGDSMEYQRDWKTGLIPDTFGDSTIECPSSSRYKQHDDTPFG